MTRHLPALDGMRAVAVVLVLTWHDGAAVFLPLRGYLGVTVFFVLSGFLITTLLLGEQDRTGQVPLRGFAVRRAFRILPLYYLALGVDVVLVYGFGRGEDTAAFTDNLRWYLTFTNEFAAPGTFGHSWSLGVEEKFYLVWPLLLAGIAVARRHRTAIGIGLLAITVAATWVPGVTYLALYAPVVAGCVIALAAHDVRTRRAFDALAHPAVAVAAVVGAVLVATTQHDGHVHTWFGLVVALALPGLVAGGGPLPRLLDLPVPAWIGRRSYAVYLFAPVVASGVALVLPAPGVVRLVVVLAITLLVAEVLFRVVEEPLRRVARARTSSRRPVPAVAA